jgi:hypothetical protein
VTFFTPVVVNTASVMCLVATQSEHQLSPFSFLVPVKNIINMSPVSAAAYQAAIPVSQSLIASSATSAAGSLAYASSLLESAMGSSIALAISCF